jgi:hypothetical protein
MIKQLLLSFGKKMTIEWDAEKIGNLDPELLKNVIDNMKNKVHEQPSVAVRFGTTGEGKRPNYEIVLRFAYSAVAKSHERDLKVDKYADENLSREFSLTEIEEILAL